MRSWNGAQNPPASGDKRSQMSVVFHGNHLVVEELHFKLALGWVVLPFDLLALLFDPAGLSHKLPDLTGCHPQLNLSEVLGADTLWLHNRRLGGCSVLWRRGGRRACRCGSRRSGRGSRRGLRLLGDRGWCLLWLRRIAAAAAQSRTPKKNNEQQTNGACCFLNPFGHDVSPLLSGWIQPMTTK